MRIARGAASHALNRNSPDFAPLTLAGVDMARDWGHARDCVRGVWMMLQQDSPRDMLLATGRQRSVRGFVEAAFGRVGVTLWYVSQSVSAVPFFSPSPSFGSVLSLLASKVGNTTGC